MSSAASYTRYDVEDPPRYVKVTLSRQGACFPHLEPAKAVVTVGTVGVNEFDQPGIARVTGRQEKQVEACAVSPVVLPVPNEPWRVEVTVDPTFVPNELDSNLGRPPGARRGRILRDRSTSDAIASHRSRSRARGDRRRRRRAAAAGHDRGAAAGSRAQPTSSRSTARFRASAPRRSSSSRRRSAARASSRTSRACRRPSAAATRGSSSTRGSRLRCGPCGTGSGARWCACATARSSSCAARDGPFGVSVRAKTRSSGSRRCSSGSRSPGWTTVASVRLTEAGVPPGVSYVYSTGRVRRRCPRGAFCARSSRARRRVRATSPGTATCSAASAAPAGAPGACG